MERNQTCWCKIVVSNDENNDFWFYLVFKNIYKSNQTQHILQKSCLHLSTYDPGFSFHTAIAECIGPSPLHLGLQLEMWCGYLGQSQPKALLPSHQMLVLMFLLQINHHTRGVVNLCAKYRSKCHCCCSLQCPNAQGIETGDKGKELVAVTPPALVLYIKTWKWKRTWIFGYTGNSASVLGPVRPSRLWKDSKAFQLQQAYQSYFWWIR